LPEEIVNDAEVTPEVILRPLFDVVYNGFGDPRSFDFDQTGKCTGEKW